MITLSLARKGSCLAPSLLISIFLSRHLVLPCTVPQHLAYTHEGNSEPTARSLRGRGVTSPYLRRVGFIIPGEVTCTIRLLFVTSKYMKTHFRFNLSTTYIIYINGYVQRCQRSATARKTEEDWQLWGCCHRREKLFLASYSRPTFNPRIAEAAGSRALTRGAGSKEGVTLSTSIGLPAHVLDMGME